MDKRKVREAIESVKPTIADRVISYFDPVKGMQRRKARVAMALSGAYTGADRSRRATKTWSPGIGDADSDTLWDLPTLRERSRDLVRNNPQAGGAINIKVGNVVGTGLRLNSRIDADYLGISEEEADQLERDIEREFRLWAESPDCDVARTLNFYAQQELVFRSTLENGDAFVMLPYVERKSTLYSLALQMIEADRVCNENSQRDTDRLAGGVEKDAYGAPIKYHILQSHPGSLHRAGRKWTKVDAFGGATGRRNVLHLYRKLRIGQTRGVPDLAPVIETLKQLGDFTDAYLMDAVISSMFTAFVHTEGDYSLDEIASFQDEHGTSANGELKLGSGNIIGLGVNEKVDFANPARPNDAFDGFILALSRQLGTALELPYEILVQQFNSSYSASKAAIEQAWTFFRNRRKWLADNFCQPVFESWMYEAVALGRIKAPGFMRDPAIRAAYLGAQWIGPSKPILDLGKEVAGREKMEDRGWITASENTAEMTGGDWERKHQQRTKEQRMRTDAGTNPTKPADAGFSDPEPEDPEERNNNAGQN